jgi:hypothetical protein
MNPELTFQSDTDPNLGIHFDEDQDLIIEFVAYRYLISIHITAYLFYDLLPP